MSLIEAYHVHIISIMATFCSSWVPHSTILILVFIGLMCLVGPYWGCCPSWGWKVDVCPCRLAPGKAADLSPDSARRARLVNRPCIHQPPNTTTRTRGEHCVHQMPQIFTPSACRFTTKVLNIHLYQHAAIKTLYEASMIIDIQQKIENYQQWDRLSTDELEK